jgi:hypothetical protein
MTAFHFHCLLTYTTHVALSETGLIPTIDNGIDQFKFGTVMIIQDKLKIDHVGTIKLKVDHDGLQSFKLQVSLVIDILIEAMSVTPLKVQHLQYLRSLIRE